MEARRGEALHCGIVFIKCIKYSRYSELVAIYFPSKTIFYLRPKLWKKKNIYKFVKIKILKKYKFLKIKIKKKYIFVKIKILKKYKFIEIKLVKRYKFVKIKILKKYKYIGKQKMWTWFVYP